MIEIMEIFRTLLQIIRNNPLVVLLVVMFAIAAPGLFGFFALLLLIPVVIIAVGFIVLLTRANRAKRDMEAKMRDAQQRGGFGGYSNGGTKAEGKVTVHIPQQETRVNDDVGEYVDFKEE